MSIEPPPERTHPLPSLLSGARRFSIGGALGIVASIARVLVAARMLSASEASSWLALQVVLAYAANAHMGVLFGTLRNVPVLRGRGETDEAARVDETSFAFVAIMSIVVGIVTWPLARLSLHAPTVTATLAAALASISLIRSYYVTKFKAEARHASLGDTTAFGGVVSVISLGLIPWLHVDGIILGMCIQYGAELVHMILRSTRPAFRMHRIALVDQLRFGGVALIGSLLATSMASIDRTIMIERSGSEAGLYYLGANAKSLVPMVVALPFAVLTPRIFERFGRGESLLPTVSYPTRATSYALTPFLALCACAVDPAIRTFFPALLGGELATIAALASCVHVVLAGFPANIFAAYDRQVGATIILALSTALSFAAAVFAAHVGYGIVGIAAAAGSGGLVYFVALHAASYVLMGQRAKDSLGDILASVFPSIVLFGTLLVMRALLLDAGIPAWPRSAAIAAVLLPLSWPFLSRARASIRALADVR